MTTRKALLVGINQYPGAPLRGCINDVMQMKEILTTFYHFDPGDFCILTDAQATQRGILDSLEWLAEGGQEPQSVRIFHYSGHGSYVLDTNGDEPDGRDECLVPYDYQTNGMITDDVLKQVYDRFHRRCNLTLVMDSCHSGSCQKDLEANILYRFIPVTFEDQEKMDIAASNFAEAQRDFVLAELHKSDAGSLSEEELDRKVEALMKKFNKNRFGDIRVREANMLLAACRADQQAADARIQGQFHGAYTYYLTETIQECHGQISYYELIKQTGLKLCREQFAQIPQLECRNKSKNLIAFTPFPD